VPSIVSKEGDVVDLGALLGAAIEPVRKLQGRQADPELTLERLTQAEVGGERKRGDQLGEADTIVGCGSLHGAESLVGPGGGLGGGMWHSWHQVWTAVVLSPTQGSGVLV
jgi:hypothetical protein